MIQAEEPDTTLDQVWDGPKRHGAWLPPREDENIFAAVSARIAEWLLLLLLAAAKTFTNWLHS